MAHTDSFLTSMWHSAVSLQSQEVPHTEESGFSSVAERGTDTWVAYVYATSWKAQYFAGLWQSELTDIKTAQKVVSLAMNATACTLGDILHPLGITCGRFRNPASCVMQQAGLPSRNSRDLSSKRSLVTFRMLLNPPAKHTGGMRTK